MYWDLQMRVGQMRVEERWKEKSGRYWLGPLMLLPLLLLAVLPASEAHATRKTDVITLYNGDRLTGEIKSLTDGRLSLGTDSMGTVNIEWKEIASLASNYNYELRLENGQRFFGSVQPGTAPGTVTLNDVFGEQSFGWQEVVEIRPVEEKATDRLDIYLSANYSFTKASNVSQTEFNGNVSYDQRDAVNTLATRLTVSDTDDESTTSSRISAQRQTWTDRRNGYRKLFAGFESNDELGLDARYTIGAGYGRYFIDSNNSTLTGSLGVQALTENGSDGVSQESLEAVITADLARWRFDSPELDLDLSGSVYPSLTERGRVRAETSARLRWEIIDDLFWNITAWNSYDSASVDEEGGEFDWGLTTGLGWTF